MKNLKLIFLVLSLIAACFGFGDSAATSSSIAQVIFYIFFGLFSLSLLFGRNYITTIE